VQELQENVMCVFILQLIGTEEKILEAEKQIDENGVIRERVEAI
ncbi:MAG: methionine ABC transporter ATP-binding protein, partial [[Ruminococcus] faecis]|nr:methionine ABC transporter ATP-binding protein [Mediterraneibacter faecis]